MTSASARWFRLFGLFVSTAEALGLAYMIEMGPPKPVKRPGYTIEPGAKLYGERPLVLYADRQWAFVPSVLAIIFGFGLQGLPEMVEGLTTRGRGE